MFKEKRDAPKSEKKQFIKNKNFKNFKKGNNDWNKKQDKKDDEEGFKRSDKVAKKEEGSSEVTGEEAKQEDVKQEEKPATE